MIFNESIKKSMIIREYSDKLDEAAEWEKWIDEIPYVKWPPDWFIKAVPPYHGTIVRYYIKTTECNHVSVYLDCYDVLSGGYGRPYWEIYPIDRDVQRCDLKDVDELLRLISLARDKDQGEK